MAYGAFWFSVMSLLVKVAGQRIPAMEIVLVRGVVSLALSYWMLRRAGIPPWGSSRGLLLVRGMLGFGGLGCFYYALVHLPLAEATVIQYTNPLFTALLAAWLLRERIGRLEVACVAASLAGVLLIARPGFLVAAVDPLPPAVVAIAVSGAVFSAAAYVTVRRLSRSEHPLVIVFYFPLVTVPATIPFVLVESVWPDAREWVLLVGIGVTTQIAQVYMTRGLQLVPAGRATAVGYMQIVFAGVWGALIFAEIPDVWSLSGASLIIGSSLALAFWRRSTTETVKEGEMLASDGAARAARGPEPP
jgi:drug/metabolite transporter (DMT)-like permease